MSQSTKWGEAAFARWTEAAGPWGQWIKPALFAQMAGELGLGPFAEVDIGWAPSDRETALVLDLSGVACVVAGVALSKAGWCPVPMFNTTTGGPGSDLVPVTELRAALAETAQLVPRKSGPPAFLLDAERLVGRSEPGSYDNRWYVFSSDFPTVAALQSAGIRRLVVVSQRDLFPDLIDALSGHVGLERVWLRDGVRREFPSARSKLRRSLALVGRVLSRNSDGTFGHPLTAG